MDTLLRTSTPKSGDSEFWGLVRQCVCSSLNIRIGPLSLIFPIEFVSDIGSMGKTNRTRYFQLDTDVLQTAEGKHQLAQWCQEVAEDINQLVHFEIIAALNASTMRVRFTCLARLFLQIREAFPLPITHCLYSPNAVDIAREIQRMDSSIITILVDFAIERAQVMVFSAWDRIGHVKCSHAALTVEWTVLEKQGVVTIETAAAPVNVNGLKSLTFVSL